MNETRTNFVIMMLCLLFHPLGDGATIFFFLAFEDERIARQRLVESACYFQASQVERAEESIHDPVETISGTTRTGWTSELIKRVVYLEFRHPDIDEIWSF